VRRRATLREGDDLLDAGGDDCLRTATTMGPAYVFVRWMCRRLSPLAPIVQNFGVAARPSFGKPAAAELIDDGRGAEEIGRQDAKRDAEGAVSQEGFQKRKAYATQPIIHKAGGGSTQDDGERRVPPGRATVWTGLGFLSSRSGARVLRVGAAQNDPSYNSRAAGKE